MFEFYFTADTWNRTDVRRNHKVPIELKIYIVVPDSENPQIKVKNIFFKGWAFLDLNKIALFKYEVGNTYTFVDFRRTEFNPLQFDISICENEDDKRFFIFSLNSNIYSF